MAVNRVLLALVFVVVFAGYLGTLVARDPGYVLIAYGEYSMQTSLWFLLALLLAGITLGYIFLKVAGIIRRVPANYVEWRFHQRSKRSIGLLTKGYRLLLEGENKRALKFLDSGTLDEEAKALNYLAAACAADQRDSAWRIPGRLSVLVYFGGLVVLVFDSA